VRWPARQRRGLIALTANGVKSSSKASQDGSEELLELALKAAGGRELFRQAREIAVTLHGSGTAIRSKRFGWVPGEIEVRCSTQEQNTVISPFVKEGQRGVFTSSEARIESVTDGTVLASRQNPRQKFPGGRRLLWWDDLDFLYFSGYAMWGYLVAPYSFFWKDVETREIEPWEQDGETWRRLDVTYPVGWQVHSRQQVYYFDSAGRLRRNDYTAEVFGGFAKSAHLCDEHKTFAGLTLPTRRRVYGRRRNNKPRPRPTLVAMDIHSASVS
jgi:hypothetical protein